MGLYIIVAGGKIWNKYDDIRNAFELFLEFKFLKWEFPYSFETFIANILFCDEIHWK